MKSLRRKAMSRTKELFMSMQEAIVNPPEYIKEMQELEKDLEYAEYEILRFQNEKKEILRKLKVLATNSETKDRLQQSH